MECTLIIGLGGAGVRISANIYNKFIDSHPSEEDREKLVCLCFDTDVQDIRSMQEKLPPEWVVKISPDLPLKAIYEQMKDISTVQDWFDDSIPFMNMTLHEGSAMSRMAARLAFLYAEAEGKLTIIDQSIEQLQALNESVHVHIICSMAGGTGSSIFLQTAYYIKEIMHQLDIHHSVMLMLGDTKDEINVVADQKGCPTWAHDLAYALVALLNKNGKDEVHETFHFTNEGQITWYDFATAVMEIGGKTCKVNPITTDQYPTKAKRPAYSVLDLSKIKEYAGIEIPDWRESLVKCIEELSPVGAKRP